MRNQKSAKDISVLYPNRPVLPTERRSNRRVHWQKTGPVKTTTIKSMLGLIHPDGGEVCYFGLPFWGHEKGIKQRIGYSTGAVNYYPKKKIRNIVSVTKTFFSAWDDGAYREYLSLFALDENKTPSELSEGMKVKLNLLLALSHRAEMLILDEPTSGLDPFSRDELLESVRGTQKAGRGCAVFHTHHLRYREMRR